MSKKRSETYVQVWMTKAEKSVITSAAKDAGMSASAYLRSAAVGLQKAEAAAETWKGQVVDLNTAVRHLAELLTEAKKKGGKR